MPTDEATGNEYYEKQYRDLREKMNNKNRNFALNAIANLAPVKIIFKTI